MRLGQSLTTLSGGEAQRLEARLAHRDAAGSEKPTLFLFDEPTTGLHFHDVRKLLGAFDRLIERGHTVLVIEHNLEVVKCADWVIDLGPEGGDEGGQVIAAGTPEAVAAVEGVSHRDPSPPASWDSRRRRHGGGRDRRPPFYAATTTVSSA